MMWGSKKHVLHTRNVDERRKEAANRMIIKLIYGHAGGVADPRPKKDEPPWVIAFLSAGLAGESGDGHLLFPFLISRGPSLATVRP